MPGRNKEDQALLQQALDHLAGADPHMGQAIRENRPAARRGTATASVRQP